MSSNVAGLIREGVAAFKAGRKEEARTLLSRATELDEHNEEAWLWLSAVVDSVEHQKICLENVLAINPSNTRALQGLELIVKRLAKQQDQPPVVKPTPQMPPPVSPFDLSKPASSQPSAAGGYHGSGGNVDLPSEDQYDDWVQGLNLGPKGATPSVPPAFTTSEPDPFDLSGGPFHQSNATPPDPFSMTGSPPPARPFSEMVSPGMEAPDYQEEEAARPRVDPFDISRARTQPYGDTAGGFGDDAFPEADVAGEFSSASPFGVEGEDSYESADDLKQYFAFIPEGIKATHLPGKSSAYPRGTLIGLALVSIGVVAGIIALVIQLLPG